jgi:hypothetical protein
MSLPNLRPSAGRSEFGCGGPVRAFFRFTMVSQAAQVANDKHFARIRKNPRFSLDPLRLYANLWLVTTWHVWPGGDGAKTGFFAWFAVKRLLSEPSVPFCGKSMEAPLLEPFIHHILFSRSNPIKPNQPKLRYSVNCNARHSVR